MTKVFHTFHDCHTALEDDLSDEIANYISLYSKLGRKFIHLLLFHEVHIDILMLTSQ